MRELFSKFVNIYILQRPKITLDESISATTWWYLFREHIFTIWKLRIIAIFSIQYLYFIPSPPALHPSHRSYCTRILLFHSFVYLIMGSDIIEDDRIFIRYPKDDAQVIVYRNTSVFFHRWIEGMIAKRGMKGIFSKKVTYFFDKKNNFSRKLRKSLLELWSVNNSHKLFSAK